jgi:hypothetical protein
MVIGLAPAWIHSRPGRARSGLREPGATRGAHPKTAEGAQERAEYSSAAKSRPAQGTCGFGPLAPFRPTRLSARRSGTGLGGRVGRIGPRGLWGNVLSTHCEEAGGRDPQRRQLAQRAIGRRGVRARSVEHFFPTSIGPVVSGRYLDLRTTPSSSTVNGNFGSIFTNPFSLG